MLLPETQWLSYAQARERQRVQALRQSDVPIEHAVSLPMPTLRWGRAGYAQFAAPSNRAPGRPALQAPPDRWWVFDARGGHLLIYALCSAIAFPTDSPAVLAEVTLTPPQPSVAALRESLAEFDVVMERIVADFFTAQQGDGNTRRQAAHRLSTVVPAELLPQYRALVPDFFAWLIA